MAYQVAILTHEKQEKKPARTKLMCIIMPIASMDEAIHVAETLKPHVFPVDDILVYDDSTDDKKVIWHYGQNAK